MVGKRVKKKPKTGWKLLGTLLAACGTLLLMMGGPQGVAVDSPQEAPMEFVEHSAAAEKPDEAPQERPAGQPKAEQEPSVIEALPPAGDASIAAEREPVEDTYFDDAVFLGDSRTEGFHLYSGLKTGTYLYATGATVESVFSKSVSTPLGRMPLLDALEKTACGKIYVMLGVNELGYYNDEGFYQAYCDAIDAIRACQPDAVIYIQGLIPLNEDKIAESGGASYLTNEHLVV